MISPQRYFLNTSDLSLKPVPSKIILGGPLPRSPTRFFEVAGNKLGLLNEQCLLIPVTILILLTQPLQYPCATQNTEACPLDARLLLQHKYTPCHTIQSPYIRRRPRVERHTSV